MVVRGMSASQTRYQHVPLDESADAVACGYANLTDERLDLAEAMSNLDSRLQQAVHLVYIQDHTREHTAAILGVDERTVRRWLEAALSQMRISMS